MFIDSQIYSQIDRGLLVLVGIAEGDGEEDILWLVRKTIQLRIFDDDKGVMNLSVTDKNYELMVVSQFTLHASTKKGNRPSYINAANPGVAIPLYEKFVKAVKNSGLVVKTGKFGADMEIAFTNYGPVTIIIDSKNKE